VRGRLATRGGTSYAVGPIKAVLKNPALMGLLGEFREGMYQELVGGEVDETHPVSRFLVRLKGLRRSGPIRPSWPWPTSK